MTINSAEESAFQAEISDFHAQHFEDQCYPAAVKNIVDRLATRVNQPDMSFSLSDANDICGYQRGLGCEEDLIQTRLSDELYPHGFEAVESQAPDMGRDQLNAIIEDDATSLPIVELDPEYFELLPEHVDGYNVQPSIEGGLSHVVIPFKINHEEVLYYDPYETYHEKEPGVTDAPYRWPSTSFYELWSGDHIERWSLWLQRRGQEVTEFETPDREQTDE